MIKIKDIIGQKHLIGELGPIKQMISNNTLQSFVLWGNSGIGKTTLAKAITNELKYSHYNLNAVTNNKKEIEEILKECNDYKNIIIIDEIHRLDKVKQNLLLPYLEKENIIVIGTTTENPMFTLNNALRSRLFMYKMEELSNNELINYLKQKNKEEHPQNILSEQILQYIINYSNDDLRKINKFFNFIVQNYQNEEITLEILNVLFNDNLTYSNNKDEIYNHLSALQKSIRASDVNASVYYLGKLLIFGEYEHLLRRLIVIANEDIGLANPPLMYNCNNVVDSFNKVGMPEGRMLLSNYVIELALSPKSNLGYSTINEVFNTIQLNPQLEVPDTIAVQDKNNNKYNREETFYRNNLPPKIKNKNFVKIRLNTNNEKKLAQRLDYINKLKNERN